MHIHDLYGTEHVPLPTASESAARDEHARDRQGVPERVLMENAGRAAAQVLHRSFPHGRVLAVLGSGNNGGDGLVMLRTLRCWGRDVAYLTVGSRPPDAALSHGHELPRVDLEHAAAAVAHADVLVDGILGTGAKGAPREPAAAVIRSMNAAGRPIVALDLPSGVDPTTADVPGVAVNADVTVGFGWPKRGLLFQPARAYCGRLVAVEIAFPPDPDAGGDAGALAAAGAALITPGWAAARLPERPPDSHKGTFGRLLVLAGSRGMAGAAAIAGRGAVRAGVGLAYLVSPEPNREILQSAVPEAVYARPAGEPLDAAAERSSALVAGPGLGTGDDARRALEHVLDRTPGRPTLLDADALNLLAGDADRLRSLAGERPVVVTPHAGEFARLVDREIAEVRAAPVEAASELADALGCVVLLKGMPSVVAAPGEPVLVNTAGSSDLASAGTGDLLAGVIGAFLAGGTDPRAAAALGLFYTGRAADHAGRGRALTPTDAGEHLDEAFRVPGRSTSTLELPFVTFDQPPGR